MTSFTDDMRARGLRPASRTLELRVSPAGARLGRLLHVSPSEPVFIARRLRLADGESMAIETLHVRESHVPGLTQRDLEERSFYELLSDRYGIVITGGEQTIEPTVTDEEESDALGVPLHSPAFRFERVTHSEKGEIVEFVESIYRGDRYKLVTSLNRPRERARNRSARANDGVAGRREAAREGRAGPSLGLPRTLLVSTKLAAPTPRAFARLNRMDQPNRRFVKSSPNP